MTAPSGVLVVDKPVGPTSHDIVAQARRLFRTKAIGHAGTLDPMASGVLLLLVEEATKLSSVLTLERKTYRARIRFGFGTDSDDALGVPTVSTSIEPGWLRPDHLESALQGERARAEQLPPNVSAIKTAGVAAHRRHRRGESVERIARNVQVHELVTISHSDEYLELSLEVSKGYYVRALARDLGEKLGVPAHLSALRRTQSGCFTLEEAVPWPSSNLDRIQSLAMTVRRVMPIRVLNGDGARRARLGQSLVSDHFVKCLPSGEHEASHAVSAWLDECGHLVALGETQADGSSRVLRGFRDSAQVTVPTGLKRIEPSSNNDP